MQHGAKWQSIFWHPGCKNIWRSKWLGYKPACAVAAQKFKFVYSSPNPTPWDGQSIFSSSLKQLGAGSVKNQRPQRAQNWWYCPKANLLFSPPKGAQSPQAQKCIFFSRYLALKWFVSFWSSVSNVWRINPYQTKFGLLPAFYGNGNAFWTPHVTWTTTFQISKASAAKIPLVRQELARHWSFPFAPGDMDPKHKRAQKTDIPWRTVMNLVGNTVQSKTQKHWSQCIIIAAWAISEGCEGFKNLWDSTTDVTPIPWSRTGQPRPKKAIRGQISCSLILREQSSFSPKTPSDFRFILWNTWTNVSHPEWRVGIRVVATIRMTSDVPGWRVEEVPPNNGHGSVSLIEFWAGPWGTRPTQNL